MLQSMVSLRCDGLSYSKISEQIKNKFGRKIHYPQIYRILSREHNARLLIEERAKRELVKKLPTTEQKKKLVTNKLKQHLINYLEANNNKAPHIAACKNTTNTELKIVQIITYGTLYGLLRIKAITKPTHTLNLLNM